jgi:predicted secreted protein
MKLLSQGLVVVLLFAGAWCANAGHRQNSQVKNLTDDDSGKALSLSKGGVFTLTLPNHLDGGYVLNGAKFDSTVLHLQSYNESAPPANSAIGHSGSAVWRFIAIKKGHTKLLVTESRPWKRTVTIISFQNLVMVN